MGINTSAFRVIQSGYDAKHFPTYQDILLLIKNDITFTLSQYNTILNNEIEINNCIEMMRKMHDKDLIDLYKMSIYEYINYIIKLFEENKKHE
jgi:hypothetical protein